ncbi:FRG domain-containing protein [uncultured Abiotrophia sp.]|uniref:FRG domain-containing protein n=1 Tax=uncultured Abiotrophia sp. TaxID=316094 RepID=UPI0028D4BC69|nr:FRG domain-containing protein [uncultured Abiotrophia sp.]
MVCKIKSLVQYMEKIEKLMRERDEKGSDYNIYYRGENGKFDNRVPGIYRGQHKKMLEVGSKNYYLELFEELGWPIQTFGSKVFEQIVEVQHYGAVTNILDLSSNPLVGLFFACYGDSQENGMVYIYGSDISREKHYFEKEIALQTALSFIDKVDIDRFIRLFSVFRKEVPNESTLYKRVCSREITVDGIKDIFDDEFKNNRSQMNKRILGLEEPDIPFVVQQDTEKEDNIEEGGEIEEVKDNIVDYIEKVDSSYKFINYLRNQGKNELNLSGYQKIMLRFILDIIVDFLDKLRLYSGVTEPLNFPYAIYEDILKSYVVKSSKINERIKNQRGAFIVPSYITVSGKALEEIQKKVDDSIKSSVTNLCEIEIPSEKKEEILKQLKYIGIDEGFIYPEIAHIAKTVSERYS